MCLCPLSVIAKKLEREVLVWDVVIRVIRIDVKGLSELAVPLLSETFFVALEWLAMGSSRLKAGGKTFDFLFPPLAVAGEESLGLAWPLFFACKWGVALIEVLVAARLTGLTTRLTAMRTRYTSILAVSAMTK